ncbi:polynucleotide 5'-hydroxyl-kinase NOL9 isoform X1 [Procambarus clarkii]|uniref:polynucleotide 5'-hydroxyl-kinase NOL9 isoform X1 n=2 Tax=Procambarus clarkii TaxID=6728 RepID=UPI003742B15E
MFSQKLIQDKIKRSEKNSKKAPSNSPKPVKMKRKKSVSTCEPQQLAGAVDNPKSEGNTFKKLARDVKHMEIKEGTSADLTMPEASKGFPRTRKKKLKKKNMVSDIPNSGIKKTKKIKKVLVVSVSKLKKSKKGNISSLNKVSKKNQIKKVTESFALQLMENSNLQRKNIVGELCQAGSSMNVLNSVEEMPFHVARDSDENQDLGHYSDTSNSFPSLNTWQDSDGEDQMNSRSINDENASTKQKNFSEGSESLQRRNVAKRKNVIKELTEYHEFIGEIVDVIAISRDTLVAAIAPGSTIYIHGLVRICPLLGDAKVLGYTLKEKEMQTIYSLSSGALLGISAVRAGNIGMIDSNLQDTRVPTSWLQDVFSNQGGPLLILEVQCCFPPFARFLSRLGWGRLFECRERLKPWCDVGATPVTKLNWKNYFLTREESLWHDVVDAISSCWTCGNVPRVVVCGGKSVGKSTFFKYIINSLLSNKPDMGIMCLDLDLGQSELSLPSCVSLVRITKPLLGPAYARCIENYASYVKQVLVGGTNPQFMLHRYIAAVQYLNQLSQEQSSLPLIINTMGWTQGTGLSIMLDVLRIIKPTHVVQIQSTRKKINFPFELHSKDVSVANGGIVTKTNKLELYYRLFVMPSAVRMHNTPHSFNPKVLRDLAIMTHVGRFIDQPQGDKGGTKNNASNLVKLPWPSVALHVCNHQIRRECILQVMNAQLVALCQVSHDNVYTQSPNHPKQLAEDTGFGELIGWGIISSINPLTQELNILTSLQPQEVTTQVNAVIMPEMYLPEPIYKLFSPGEGPYLQYMHHEGAGRLKVNRQLKPRKSTRSDKPWR